MPKKKKKTRRAKPPADDRPIQGRGRSTDSPGVRLADSPTEAKIKRLSERIKTQKADIDSKFKQFKKIKKIKKKTRL
jgi:hypothetical protein